MQSSQHAEYEIRTCLAFGRSVEETDVVKEGKQQTRTGQVWPHLVVGRDRRIGTADQTITGIA